MTDRTIQNRHPTFHQGSDDDHLDSLVISSALNHVQLKKPLVQIELQAETKGIQGRKPSPKWSARILG